MAWGNKVTKEDLVSVGLDPDKFASLVGTAASKDDLTALKIEMSTLITDTIKTQFAELEGRITTARNTTTTANTEREIEQTQVDPIDFMSNPTPHIKKLMNESQAPLVAHLLTTAADSAYKDAKRDTEAHPFFKKFETEIKEMWDKQPLANKQSPTELIGNIYKIIVANHLQEITTDAAKNGGQFNIIASGGTSGSGNTNTTFNANDPVEVAKRLTEDELKTAKGFGMTAEEYAKEKVSGGLSYA